MSITEAYRGKPCPHGDTYGSCCSSMCYIWTLEEVFEDKPELVEAIRAIEKTASAELGMEVYYDFPVDQEEAFPHPRLQGDSLCFTTREDPEHNCGKLQDVLYDISGGTDYEVAGSYITHVLMNPA